MSGHASACVNCRHRPCVSKVPIFAHLSQEELLQVVSLVIHRDYAKGEIIQLEQDSLENLVVINQGRVKAYRVTREGKEQIIYIFSPGDFFGENNLLRHGKASYNVEALVNTQVCLIRKQDFQNLLREYPEIGLKIMEELCTRLEHLETTVENLGTKDTDARINSVLVEFAERYGEKHAEGTLVKLPFSRQGIADYIGLRRETVSRKLSSLQTEGVIKMVGNKRIIILEQDALM